MTCSLYGQADSYYLTINPNNSSFITDIQTRIRSPYTTVSYTNFINNVNNFASRDTIVNDTAKRVFTDIYSGENCVYTPPFTWGSAYSREHTYCQSWWPVAGTSNPYYSDQHHLFPADQPNVNGMRSNNPLGEVVTASYTFLECKLGNDATGKKVFEPRASHKGDAARALLYMALRYNGVTGYGDWTFNYLNTHYLAAQNQDVATLIKWHKQDPPDKWEIDRNNYVQSVQQNRNPLVDHPEYVNYLNFNDLSKVSPTYAAEPTLKAGNFVVTKGASSVTVSWATVSSGAQIPSGYLLQGFQKNDYFLPIDGETYTDDTNWSDSAVVVNVAYGTGFYTFTGVDTSKQFYFKLFPYNGTGSLRNYMITGLADNLTLLQPIGNESWGAGSVNKIVWSSLSIANVKLEYSSDGGTNWITIIASTPASSGYYDWTVPGSVSANCKVRVSDASASSTNSVGAGLFAITLSSTNVNLTSPVGSENWQVNSLHNITWTSSSVTNAKLEYTTDGGTNWSVIIASTAASAGTYSWTVPNSVSAICKVRISDASNAEVNSISSSAFTISAIPVVSITSPVGGESWVGNSSHNITWSSTSVTKVKLEYTIDGGTNWVTISSSTIASAGTYSWTVPNTASANCKVRVSDTANAATSSVSAAIFTISQVVGSVSITSPVGGESWAGNSAHNITWTSTNVTNVKLEYTTDGGTNWSVIIASTLASTNTYNWTVPNVSSSNCKVRISDAANAATSSVSAAVFTITQVVGNVSITSPVGGESWAGSSAHNITWTSSNVTNVKLEYTTDSGTNWSVIIASTLASAGTYSWIVPNTASTNCKVRISDALNAAVNSVSSSAFTITVSSYVSPANFAAGLTLTQNFDSLGITAIAVLPFKWKADKNVTARTVGTYAAAVSATEQSAGNTMSGTATNGIYNYGAGVAASATDRALGGLSSSAASKSVNVYTALTNAGVSNITSLNISYDIEKYRTGTNAIGFSVQMYYSADGSVWTSAGTDFLTSFASDATTAGYASAPGATTSVSNKTLSVPITAGSQLYLAWNYSVTSGTTTTSAQGLGLDNVSITGVATVSAPTTQASGITFSSVQPAQVTAAWTNGNGAGRVVVVNTVNTFTTPTDGISPTASQVYAGSGEQVVFNGVGSSVTVTGLIANTQYYFRVYEYNGSSSSTKYLSSTGINNPDSQTTSQAALSSSSDIIANASFTTPVNIDYTQYQEATLTSASLEAAKFDIRDGGGAVDADAQGTTLTSISFNVTNSSNLRSIALFDGTTKLSEVAPTSTITFSGLSIAAVDGGSKVFSVRTSFLTTVTDNQQFAFTISSATANPAGSSFASSNAGGAASTTSGNSNKIIVNAAKLRYVQQPSSSMINTAVSPAVTVEAVDANNNRDLDYITSVVITATGPALNGTPVSVIPVSGLATFSSLTFSSSSNTAVLNAASSSFTSVVSSSFVIQESLTYTWVGTSNGSWTDAANWSPTRTTPGTTDVIQFNNGGSLVINNLPTETIGKLLVSNSTIVKLRAAAAVTLTVGNTNGTDFSVAAGSALNLGSTSIISLALPALATGIVSGTMTCDSAAHKILPVDNAGLTFQTGSVLTQACLGNIFGATGAANAVVFELGATFVSRLGSNPFALTSPNSKVLFKSGSTYSHESSSAPSLSGRTYANFQMNNGSTLSATGGGVFTCDNLTIALGVLNLNLTGGITIKGNISVASGTTLTFSPVSANTITFGGSAQQTINNSGTLSFGNFANVTLNNTEGLVLNSDLILNGMLTLQNGKFNIGNNKLILNSAATIAGTFSSSNMITVSGNGLVQKILTGALPHTFVFPVGDITNTAQYSPVTYTLKSGTFTADTIGVSLNNTKHSAVTDGVNYLNRYWSLTSAGVTSPTYDVVFTYLPEDVVGDETALSGGLYSTSAWTNLGAVNSTAHTITASSQTAFGDFTSFPGSYAQGMVNVTFIPEGYYRSDTDPLPVTDVFTATLASASGPDYTDIETVNITLDSVTYTGTATFNSAPAGSYYLVIKGISIMATWSASPIVFTKGNTVSYDFTTGLDKAFAIPGFPFNAMIQQGSKWCIYSGDVDQDELIGNVDLTMVDNDAFATLEAHGPTDIDGDALVGNVDLTICDNHAFSVIESQTPRKVGGMAAKYLHKPVLKSAKQTQKQF